jgi:hypothetical protein
MEQIMELYDWLLNTYTALSVWFEANVRLLFVLTLSTAIAVGLYASFYGSPWHTIKKVLNFKQHWRSVRRRWRGYMTMRQHAKRRAREDQIISDAITDVLEQLSNYGIISDSSKKRWYKHLGRKGLVDLLPRKNFLGPAEVEFKKQLSKRRMDGLLVEHFHLLPGYNAQVTADYLAWREATHAALTKPKPDGKLWTEAKDPTGASYVTPKGPASSGSQNTASTVLARIQARRAAAA